MHSCVECSSEFDHQNKKDLIKWAFNCTCSHMIFLLTAASVFIWVAFTIQIAPLSILLICRIRNMCEKCTIQRWNPPTINFYILFAAWILALSYLGESVKGIIEPEIIFRPRVNLIGSYVSVDWYFVTRPARANEGQVSNVLPYFNIALICISSGLLNKLVILNVFFHNPFFPLWA